ncbi:conserved hypothetical protein [Histoplasma capsulatum var. duboisii H88]|nr:conserved hypothetical protein [Histoplasma capsulatum H143]EGC49775.1 conserved hypothetical protein [Histoplasma capsulatum var. duboisii H88]OJD23423.1 hypothetical protein ACJ73_05216 [Blastomyces percursus]
MPAITDPDSGERKKVVIRRLRSMYMMVKQFKPSSFGDSDLTRLGIKLLPLDLTQPAATGPCFYAPVSENEVPGVPWGTGRLKLYEPEAEDNKHSYRALGIIENASRWMGSQLKPGSGHTEWSDTLLTRCYREDPGIPNARAEYLAGGANYNWSVNGDVEAYSVEYPHCKFHILQDAEAEEPLRRSEILPILVFMRWRMSILKYPQHEVFPVLVISHFGIKGRILIAHFDGTHLCIQKSDIYDLRGGEDAKNFELFARWRASDAAGKTKVALPVDIKPLKTLAVRGFACG